MTLSYLYVDVLEQGDMKKKVVSKGWCKESNQYIHLEVVMTIYSTILESHYSFN